MYTKINLIFIFYNITDIYVDNLLKPLKKGHARFTGDVIWNLVPFIFRYFIVEIPNFGEVTKTLCSPTHYRRNNEKVSSLENMESILL